MAILLMAVVGTFSISGVHATGFPVVDARASTNGTTASSNAVVTLAGSQNNGDTLIVLHRSADGTASHGYPANWNVLFNDNSDASDDRISAAWCNVSGTSCSSGGTITITQTSSKFASIAFTISNAIDPTIRAPEFSTLTTGSTATPDPGNLSPTGGSKDYLWIWAGGWEGEQTSPPSANPTNYANPTGADSGIVSSVATNTRVATAERTLTASSEDPGSWTISTSDDWTATVIAVHPFAEYTQNPTASMTMASSLAREVSTYKTLTASITEGSSLSRMVSIFKSLTASITIDSSLARTVSIFRSFTASLQFDSSMSRLVSIFQTLAASVTITMGNMVANVNSGQLTCNSSPRSCSTSLTATWTMASGFVDQTSLFRSLSGSLSLAGSQVKGLARSLSGSLGSASSLAGQSSLFRSLSASLSPPLSQVTSLARALTGSLSLAGSQVKGLARSLSGSLSSASSLVEQSSLFRSLSGSLSLAGSQVKGLARSLTGSLSSASGLAEQSSLFRSVSGSLGLAASQTKGLARSLSGSLGSASSLAGQSSLFRSLSGSLSSVSSLAGQSSLFRSLSGSLSSASSLVEQSSLFRSLSGSLSSASGLAEQTSLFRSLSGAWTMTSGFAEKASLFRSLSGSLTFVASQISAPSISNVHTFYLGSSIVDTCSGRCENLVRTTGAADTTTSQSIGNNVGKYQVQPDIGSTTTTGTPSTSSVSGYAWVYNTDLGGLTIQSGTWTF